MKDRISLSLSIYLLLLHPFIGIFSRKTLVSRH